MKITATTDVDEDQALLPFWSDSRRGIPNSLARSAFFTVGSKKDARIVTTVPKKIASFSNYEIKLAGEELRTDDSDVLLQLLHLSRQHPTGEPIVFSAYSFLKELGWGHGGRSYERLQSSIERMQRTSVQIREVGHRGFQGPLISRFYWRETEACTRTDWAIVLDKEIINLFRPSGYTLLLWHQRQRLRSDLAKWCHTFYSTHQVPIPIKVATIKEHCGSRTKRLTDFRKALRVALEDLRTTDFLDEWVIDARDCVRVIRSRRIIELAEMD